MSFCTKCGEQMDADAKFCMACGSRTAYHDALNEKVPVQIERKSNPPDTVPTLLEMVKSGARSSIGAVKHLIKHPKQMMPMLVLSAIWLLLSLLTAFGINPVPIQVLSLISFAQGGLYGGVLGAVGGVIGKAVYAYVISVLILPILTGKKPFKGAGIGFKRIFSGLAVQSVNALALLLTGFGLALVYFNFMTGNATLINSMAGVVGFILALKGLWKNSGFLWGVLFFVAQKASRGKLPSHMAANRMLAGFAAGSAASIALSALPTPYLLYLIGALLTVAGIILAIVVKPGKEAAAA